MTNIIGILCFCIFHSTTIARNKDIEPKNIFPIWNQATLNSLKRQLAATTVEKSKKDYTNRIFGFKALMQIENERSIIKESIRYQFLQLVLSEAKIKEVFVIETTTMASTFILRNFLATKLDENTYQIGIYIYLGENGWKKEGTAIAQHLEFELPLTKCLEKSGKGFNYQDVIISHWDIAEQCNVSSEYYLPTTLSFNCGVKKLLDMHEKGEFK